jgi:uncharacterized protein YaaN involved in tellurite resistance
VLQSVTYIHENVMPDSPHPFAPHPPAPGENAGAPAPAEQVRELAESIDLLDPALSVTYGARAMADISRFADDLLRRVRVSDSGPVGEILSELLLRLKKLDFADLGRDGPGFLERLPGIGAVFNAVTRSLVRFDTVAGQVESIAARLDQSMVGLLRDIEILEQLYTHNARFHNELNLFIAAGDQRLEQARARDLPRMAEEAQASGDPLLAQGLRDFTEAVARFERRLHDLRLSRTLTLQTAPQIRLIQNSSQILAEKIQAGILTTIPLWKSQMILALSLHRQRGSSRLHKDVVGTTNDLLRRNATALRTATTEAAREAERSLVDIETVRDMHGSLLTTLEETLRIARQAREKRLDAEKELSGMERHLRGSLAAFAHGAADV